MNPQRVNCYWRQGRPERPLAHPAYLLLSLRELYELVRAQSAFALEFAREILHAHDR